jgi:hypothetical protein
MPLDFNAIGCRRPEFEMFPIKLTGHESLFLFFPYREICSQDSSRLIPNIAVSEVQRMPPKELKMGGFLELISVKRAEKRGGMATKQNCFLKFIKTITKSPIKKIQIFFAPSTACLQLVTIELIVDVFEGSFDAFRRS